MDEKTVSTPVILIVAAPGDLQAGLQVLLAKLPDVEILAASGESAALNAMVRHRPSLLILDVDVAGSQSPALLNQIKGRWPNIRCLVLLNQAGEQQAALSGGADAALIKGFPAARLVPVVEGLLRAENVKPTTLESKKEIKR